jgi:pre-mRNA-splicing factor SYF1
MKLLLTLARKAARGKCVSLETKSAYQILGDFMYVVECFAGEVGLNVPETVQSNEADAKAETQGKDAPEVVSVDLKLIRVGGPAVPVTADGNSLPAYDEDEDLSKRKLNIERIVRKDGIEVYKDQAGRLWTGLATFWIKRGKFNRANSTFQAGIAMVLTVRDFSRICDAYAEFNESLLSALMESLENPDDDEDEDDAKETERELDAINGSQTVLPQ